MISVGIDIIEIERIKNLVNDANRILSAEEIMLFNKQNLARKKEFLAGRWALKEAIFKALPHEQLIFKNINISYNNYKQPVTVIKNYNILLSLSHNQSMAVAVAIIRSSFAH